MSPTERTAALTVCALATNANEARTVLGRLGLIDTPAEPSGELNRCGHPMAESFRGFGTRGNQCRACRREWKNAARARARGVA